MSAAGIHFGTSGWRGVIADDFTFGRVRLTAAAIARMVRSRAKAPKLLVAFDTRFFSEDFARSAAGVLASMGVHPILAARATPAPAIAFEVRRRKLHGAIHITASHNPAEYSGLKFIDAQGAPAGPDESREIERLATLEARGDKAFGPESPLAAAETAECETADAAPAYLEHLAQLIRFDAIRRSRLSLVYDAMHGSGAGWLDRLLAVHGIPVEILNAERDVLFDGHSPDPAPAHLGPLAHAVRRGKAQLGLATDGDANRFGILDAHGHFLSPNHILGLAFDYLVDSRGWRLGVVRSVATSHLVDAVARLHGLPAWETPVGFKHIAPFILDGRVALGGEESAGLSIRGHVPDKDGILACLLAAEMVAERGPFEAQLAGLFRRVGREFWPVRLNVSLGELARERQDAFLQSDPAEFLGRRVARADRADGLKLEFEDGSWLLVRPSGTEPLSRIYAEAATLEKANRLAKEAERWILG
jgi:phosphoglucomutase